MKRRFVVGSATVEVTFRKREATNEEVAEVLAAGGGAGEAERIEVTVLACASHFGR